MVVLLMVNSQMTQGSKRIRVFRPPAALPPPPLLPSMTGGAPEHEQKPPKHAKDLSNEERSSLVQVSTSNSLLSLLATGLLVDGGAVCCVVL